MADEFRIRICILSIHKINDNRIKKYTHSFISNGCDVINIHFTGNEYKEVNDEIQFPVTTNKIKKRLAFVFKTRILNYLQTILQNDKSIIFHIHDPIVLNLASNLKKIFKFCKIVYDRHEFYERFKTLHFFNESCFYEKLNKKYIDILVVVNKSMEQVVNKKFNKKTIVVGNFPVKNVSIDRKEYLNNKNNILTISYIGNYLSFKDDRDIPLILNLADIIENTGVDYRFYIAGYIADDKLFNEIKKRQEKSNNKFSYLGYISREDVIEYTKKSHIGLLFYNSDWTVPYSPNKLYEYILYGVIPILRLCFSNDFDINNYTNYFYSFEDSREKVKSDFFELINNRQLINLEIKKLLAKDYDFYWENDFKKLFTAVAELEDI
jgi:glycosyltransferase involved in cell wall biosynthesis